MTNLLKAGLVALGIALAAATFAHGQTNTFPSGDGYRVPGAVAMCPSSGGTYVPCSDSGALAAVGAQSHVSSATFTPAAASHTAGDVNGGAQEFASVGPSGRSVIITSAALRIDGGTAEATAWRLYLYTVTPPSALADDAAWDLPSGDRASFVGYVDIGTAVDLGSTQWVETHGINKQVRLTGTSLFGYLVNGTTLTPAAVAHVVRLHTVAP